MDTSTSLQLGDGSPEQTKSAKFADLNQRIRALEKRREPHDNLDDIRRQVLASLARASSSHWHLGQDLYRFREALEWGCWYSILDEMSRATHISRRTLLEIVEQYEKVKDAPPEVLEAFNVAGVNPAAPRRRDELALAIGSWSAGMPAKQAALHAIEQSKHHRAPETTFPEKLNTKQQWIYDYRIAGRAALRKVPENQKAEVIVKAAAEEIWLLTGVRQPITITPEEPIVDLSGRRREEQAES